MPSHAKADRVRAADALKAFRLFPAIAQQWCEADLSSEFAIDKVVKADGLDDVEGPIEGTNQLHNRYSNSCYARVY